MYASFPLGHQFNVNEYTTQELLEKVQLADSLFDQGNRISPHRAYITSSMNHPVPASASSVSSTRSDARLCLSPDRVQHARRQSARDESRRGRLRH
jgi:hypothetical protein